MRRAAILAAGAAGLAATMLAAGCGGASGERTFGTYTDCATVGKLSSATDPAHDQSGELAGAPPVPQGDLLSARIARGNGRLCLELRARSAIKPAAAYVLVLRPPTADTPAVQLEATVLAAEAPTLLINTGGPKDPFRRVRGDVGIRGDRLSIVIGRSQFQANRVEAIFDAFRYQLRSAVVTRNEGRLTDCMPDCS